MARIPLGGRGRDYDSNKSRESLVNMIFESNLDGSFQAIRRTEGLTLFATTDPIRSNLLVTGGVLYFVAGDSFYSSDTSGVITTIGVVSGGGRAQLHVNARGAGSQILILTGGGSGFTYTVAGGLVVISDASFFPTDAGAILNERFWLARKGTNQFFASEISDGTAYNALSIATAEEAPDDVVSVISKKSSLWVLGTNTTEFWQTFDDPNLPVRRVRYATKERGILAKDSLAEVGEFFAFLADDKTVRLVRDTDLTTISDLDLELRIKGNGTKAFPGFKSPEKAFGFFVDGPVHKVYYLTFPEDAFTWGYDIETGLTHTRSSESFPTWRIGSSTKFNNQLIGADYLSGNLWVLDAASLTEGGGVLRTKLISPPISFERDITIPLIELELEVGQVTSGIDPQLMVYYTKDGGNTWTNKGSVSLGERGDFAKRVPLRQFGRLVRHKEFAIRLETTDEVPFKYYGMYLGQ